MSFTVCAIDVGLVNLGLVVVEVSEEYNLEHVLFADRIDLTDLPHRRVKFGDCSLYHSKDAADRVEHFLQEYEEYLREASVVLIERQPPTGLVNVEQLLFCKLREKAFLCCPRPVHCYFGIQMYEYDQRKVEATKLAEPYLRQLPTWSLLSDRLHDICDAFCMMLWWLKRKKLDKQRKPIPSTSATPLYLCSVGTNSLEDLDAYFEQFRCPVISIYTTPREAM